MSGTRAAFYAICLVGALASAERQVFDFLGYMWLPILANFLNLVSLTFCLFGVWQSRPAYVATYMTWSLVWAAWNAFVICFYLEVGGLRVSDDYLNFGTGSFSWWVANGLGCNAEYNTTVEEDSSSVYYYPIRPSKVTGCVMDFQFVEVAHAGVHLALAACGILVGLVFLVQLKRENREKEMLNEPVYSVQYSVDTQQPPSRVMTPRRVKRRSYTRSSTRSATNPKSLNRNRRSSTRSDPGGRNKHKNNNYPPPAVVNPVNALMQRPRDPDSSTSCDDTSRAANELLLLRSPYGRVNPAYEETASSVYGGGVSSRAPSVLTSYSNFHGQRRIQPALVMEQHHNFLQPMTKSDNIVMNSDNNSPASSGNTNNNNHHQVQSTPINASFDDDDLPPPPPPLTLQEQQVPVPQQRSAAAKRAEYVNMPLQPIIVEQQTGTVVRNNNNARPESISLGVNEEDNVVVSRTAAAPSSSNNTNTRAGILKHSNNNDDYNNSRASSSNGQYSRNNGAIVKRGIMPAPSQNGGLTNGGNHVNDDPLSMFRQQNGGGSIYNSVYNGSSDDANSRSSMAAAVTTAPAPLPPRNSSNINNVNTNNDVRASKRRNFALPPPTYPEDAMYALNQRLEKEKQSLQQQQNGYDMETLKAQGHILRPQQQQQMPQQTNNYKGMNGSSRNHNGVINGQASVMNGQATRGMNGQASGSRRPIGNDEDDYGFTSGGARGGASAKTSAGLVSLPLGSNASSSSTNANNANNDKWYLKDSMRPVGSTAHGGNCRCYRCQRKYTAI